MIKFSAKTWLDPKRIAKAIEQATIDPKERCALSVAAEAKQSMSGGRIKITARGGPTRTKAGKRLAKRRIMSVPSPPGTPPHVQTGVLRASIGYAQVERSYGTVFLVGSQDPPASYGAIHEFGGRYHPPRPFMWPALVTTAPRFAQFFRRLPVARTPAGRELKRAVDRWQRRWGGRF